MGNDSESKESDDQNDSGSDSDNDGNSDSSEDSQNDSQSNENSEDSQSGEDSLNGSNDDDSLDEDECAGLAESDCNTMYDDDGDQECAFNKEGEECYGIARRAGQHGSGNYDDGFNAAQTQAAQKTDELVTIIGVLGAVVAMLMLVVVGGAYYVYSKKKGPNGQIKEAEMETEESSDGKTANVEDNGEEKILIETNVHSGIVQGDDADPEV